VSDLQFSFRFSDFLEALQERLSTGQPKHKQQPRVQPVGPVAKVRCYKAGDASAPAFPEDFEIVYYQTLQV
jgi:hypothetical protein